MESETVFHLRKYHQTLYETCWIFTPYSGSKVQREVQTSKKYEGTAASSNDTKQGMCLSLFFIKGIHLISIYIARFTKMEPSHKLIYILCVMSQK